MGVVGQAGDQLVLERIAAPGLVMVQKLHLHFGHVDAGGAVALAALAAHAEVHRFLHGFAGEGIGAELAGDRQPQRVGPSPRQMLFVTRHAVAGAHGAGVKLAAMAIVVAHLHGLGKALRRVAAGARCAGLLGHRVVLHVPGTPVECSLDGDDLVAGRKAHQAGVVHFGQ